MTEVQTLHFNSRDFTEICINYLGIAVILYSNLIAHLFYISSQ